MTTASVAKAIKGLQLTSAHPGIDLMHQKHGDPAYAPIYGTGCIDSPKLVLVFMNPTARNVSALREWSGMRAPWLGLKQTWKLFYRMGILDQDFYETTQTLKPAEWTPEFTEEIYRNIAKHKVFSTNLAKATQSDARPLHDRVFIDSRDGFLEELRMLKAKHVITFGNQVSSVLLGKPVRVSEYADSDFEELKAHGRTYRVYPCFYPVGRGWMNLHKVIPRVQSIIREV